MQSVRWSRETNTTTKEKKDKVKLKVTLKQTINAQAGNKVWFYSFFYLCAR
jgi:hypothetical protein